MLATRKNEVDERLFKAAMEINLLEPQEYEDAKSVNVAVKLKKSTSALPNWYRSDLTQKDIEKEIKNKKLAINSVSPLLLEATEGAAVTPKDLK